jgi:hypothetical protein
VNLVAPAGAPAAVVFNILKALINLLDEIWIFIDASETQ